MASTQTTNKKQKKAGTAVVAKAASTALSKQDMATWAKDAQKITAQDIMLPKILAMQGLSKKVTDGEAAFGEFRDSLNNNCVGSMKKPFKFIPLHLEKLWVEFTRKTVKKAGKDVDSWDFSKIYPIDHTNENLPYEEDDVRRNRTMQYYVLLPEELEKGTALPYVLSFQRTSLKAGKKLSTTMFIQNIQAGKTPASMVMECSGIKRENDLGTFIVMDVKQSRATTDKELKVAFEWYQRITAGQTKVDNSDIVDEAKEGATVSGESDEF